MPNGSDGPAAGPGHSQPGAQATAGGEPVFQVVAGHPTPADIAAVTAALTLTLATRARRSPRRRRPGAWAARSALLRPQLTPGPDAWRRSALPR